MMEMRKEIEDWNVEMNEDIGKGEGNLGNVVRRIEGYIREKEIGDEDKDREEN